MGSNRMFALGAVTVFAGYLVGALTAFFRGGDTSYVTAYLTGETVTDWGRAFLSGPLFLLLVQCCGLFFFGWLIALPLVFYKSYGLGYTAGLFLAAFGAKGFLPLGLCLFPSGVALCAMLVRGAQEAIPQSFALFRGLYADSAAFFSSLKAYLLRSLVVFQCVSFVLLWDLFFAPMILNGIRDLL